MMAVEEGFGIEVSSHYAEWWRFNVAIACGCFDEAGKRIDFVSAEDRIVPVGSEQSVPPEGWQGAGRRRISVHTAACDHIVMYIYLIPHTLPVTNEVDAAQPFDIRVKITYGGRSVGDMPYRINAWSGSSLEIKLRKDGTPYVE